ncbi:MAG: hypothetical protein ACKO96_04045, partial [Flammeovirgaceae bacterium]
MRIWRSAGSDQQPRKRSQIRPLQSASQQLTAYWRFEPESQPMTTDFSFLFIARMLNRGFGVLG